MPTTFDIIVDTQDYYQPGRRMDYNKKIVFEGILTENYWNNILFAGNFAEYFCDESVSISGVKIYLSAKTDEPFYFQIRQGADVRYDVSNASLVKQAITSGDIYMTQFETSFIIEKMQFEALKTINVRLNKANNANLTNAKVRVELLANE